MRAAKALSAPMSNPPDSSSCPPFGATLSIKISRSSAQSSVSSVAGALPSLHMEVKTESADSVSPFTTASSSSSVRRFPARPIAESTLSLVISALPEHWSSRESPSRREPSARRESSSAALGSSLSPSCCATYSSLAATVSGLMRRKLWRWQRESIVAGTF